MESSESEGEGKEENMAMAKPRELPPPDSSEEESSEEDCEVNH